jgi:hypothetical protein
MTQREPTEEEVRAALEEQLKRLTVDDMLLESTVSLLNLGARRAGVAEGTAEEKDLDQVRTAVEAVRAVLPLIERGRHAQQVAPLRDALARLQMTYAQQAPGPGQEQPSGGAPSPEPPGSKPGEKGPAQSSGKLWVPGQ